MSHIHRIVVQTFSTLTLAIASFALSLLLHANISAQPRPPSQQPSRTNDAGGASEKAGAARPLVSNKLVERLMVEGEEHPYSINLSKGQFLHAAVKQMGADVTVTLFSPAGEKLKQVDLIKEQGTESLSWVASYGGAYHLVVHGPQKVFHIDPSIPPSSRRYEIVMVIKPSATPQDRDRMMAEDLLIEAWDLELKGTPDTQAQSMRNREQALKLWQRLKDRHSTAYTLSSIGSLYSTLGEFQKALQYRTQALRFQRAVSDRTSEADTLYSIAATYISLGETQKALESFSQALSIERTLGRRLRTAGALLSIGNLYNSLGEYQKALEFFKQAIPIYHAAGYTFGEAGTLYSIGSIYSTLGEHRKAVEYFDKALKLQHDREKFTKAETLNKIATAYHALGDFEKTIDAYNRAALQFRAGGYKYGEAKAFLSIGLTYSTLGQKQNALAATNQALPLARAADDMPIEAETLSLLMNLWRHLQKPKLAIFYGKQSVNIYQQLRTNIKGLEKQLQRNYLRSIESSYRQLADLLISEGRLPEAQQVLTMLKEEEYFSFMRRDSNETSPLSKRATLTPKESEWEHRYNEIAGQVVAIGVERGALVAKLRRTPEEEQRLLKLEKDLEVANQHFQTFLSQMANESVLPAETAFKVTLLRETQSLQDDLRVLSQGAVALYTVVGEEKYRVILVTPDAQLAREYPIKADDLNRKVLAFREAVQNPKADPLPLAQELYRIIVAPVSKDLEQAGAKTLMWSLDGALRYVPIAALHDGRQYMVEHYRNVVITLASERNLKDLPSPQWTGLGFGVAKAHQGFSALPAVPAELRSVIHDATSSGTMKGALPGKIMLDEEFTAETMKSELRQRYPVVHIASHFAMKPGDETNSFLLLGDGSRLTVAELKRATNLFSGVELLTLSACDTASGGTGTDGKEVEGFGVWAQRQGAKAVVASLWPVADQSTQMLMQQFYRTREGQLPMSKAEALRQAQLALLRNQGQIDAERRGISLKIQKNSGQQTPYTHPFYWAPFILIGNWR